MKNFLVSDVHGCYKELLEMLKYYDEIKEEKRFIYLGDAVDRGSDSLKVIQKLIELQKDGAIILRGNHDQMFLNWLQSPFEDRHHYYYNGGLATIESFMNGESVYDKGAFWLADYIKKEYKDEISFLRELPYYHEDENFICVHAGINYSAYDWRTDKSNMLWIREHFYLRKNTTGKEIFFGHTPTSFLHPLKSNNNVFIDTKRNINGIDGGCVFGGQLNGVVINEFGQIEKLHKVEKM